ncbi:MAG: IS66 family insertion sequence element accessory protein TnpB [Geoalkalibacter sp.]|uniref:IS66 family insertion sequence element accessory protein TnpB n=1 Tax=Geoalkalibacter sp. TaxID=3041440 RepID=UPI003D0F0E72
MLAWDGDGFAIWYKRLEQGTFPDCFPGRRELTRQQFVLLLEGIVPKRLSRRFSL